jgi:hypothetical protein
LRQVHRGGNIVSRRRATFKSGIQQRPLRPANPSGAAFPQEFVRGKKDQQAPPWVRPEGPEITLTPGQVTPEDL